LFEELLLLVELEFFLDELLDLFEEEFLREEELLLVFEVFDLLVLYFILL